MSKSKKSSGGADYEIGRGKPPQHSRWEKGRSGNPGGKKKGTLNLQSAFQDALLRPVTVTVEGEKKIVSVLEALVMRLLEAGLKGDLRAINSILDRIERLIGFDREREIETSEEDLEILQRVLARRNFKVGANRRATSDAAETEEEIDTTPDESEDDHA